MNLEERIARRHTASGRAGLLLDRNALSPTVHLPTPIGRGTELERLLDAVEPVFAGELPAPFAVAGPPGSGTSAIVTALFDALTAELAGNRQAIGTTTRAGTDTGEPTTWFVTVDARRVTSAFAFYRAVLSTISAEPVPTSGVGTAALRERMRQRLESPDNQVVIAIDHHDEPETLTANRVSTLLDAVTDSTTVVPVGQRVPDDWGYPVVDIPAYRHHELVDILSERASAGLTGGALDHQTIRSLAAWADGNAHDALSALFNGAILASESGEETIESASLERAKADVPPDCVHVDRALALPETRQQVLCALVGLGSTGGRERERLPERPIRDLATEIADRGDLAAGTVKRLLYELAEHGLLERIPLESSGSGRQPSTLKPRFPTIAFRALTTVQPS
ncbi:Cdc6/Cdc18 family protein [Natrialbaceae archaeon A-CW1-1]